MRLNTFFKYAYLELNLFILFLGLFQAGFGVYVTVSDWGKADEDFFFISGLVGALLGIFASLTAYIGVLGVTNQTKRFIESCWTGKRVLGVHQIILWIIEAAEIYCYFFVRDSFSVLFDTKDKLENNPDSNPSYSSLEKEIADVLNRFFFSARANCSSYTFLWLWVNQYCQEDSLHSEFCRGCHSYSVTLCSADEITCGETEGFKGGPTCPYTICRKNALNFLIDRVAGVFLFTVAGLIILNSFLILLNIFLLCYDPKSSPKVKVRPIIVRPTNSNENEVITTAVRGTPAQLRENPKNQNSKNNSPRDNTDNPPRVNNQSYETLILEPKENSKNPKMEEKVGKSEGSPNLGIVV